MWFPAFKECQRSLRDTVARRKGVGALFPKEHLGLGIGLEYLVRTWYVPGTGTWYQSKTNLTPENALTA